MDALTVSSINIARSNYSDDDGPFTATVHIKGQYQELKLRLPEELSSQIVAVVAEQIVSGSRQVADNLTRSALNHKALEHIPN